VARTLRVLEHAPHLGKLIAESELAGFRHVLSVVRKNWVLRVYYAIRGDELWVVSILPAWNELTMTELAELLH
jgi:hypothetical protein